LIGLLILGLGYAASRTVPLLTPAFEEWGQDVVMSNVQIRRFLSLEAARKVTLPPPQQFDERGPDFGPLLQAFAEASISPQTFWPTRTFEVSVSVEGEPTLFVYHCVVEFFCWRVRDISCVPPCP
jgi:hypothetical protein